MPRFFNTAGPCDPADHYMLPPERRLTGIRELIEQKLYFVIHAPRQTGKTTCFRALARTLTAQGRYAALYASCERSQTHGGNLEMGVQGLLESLRASAEIYLPEAAHRPPEPNMSLTPLSRLNDLLQRWARGCALPTVLFLDEIDALLNDVLISVLRQIRDGYPNRPRDFPQSVALIGLRDVRDYKAKVRPDATSLGTASPFNVKVESLTLRNFTEAEVAELYAQHTQETGQGFTPEALKLAWELTQGQPWLVNALARQVVEKDVRERRVEVTAAHIEAAKEALIQRRDTHLDSLLDKLRDERVRRVLEPILAGELLLGDRLDDDLAYVEDLGLVSRAQGGYIQISNPIYQEILPRALAYTIQSNIANRTEWYVKRDGTLDMEGLLDAFVEFWREHGEALLQHQPYPEAAPQLILMAFLQRVVNGGGSIEREYAVGSGRMDLCVRWRHAGGEQREGLELKVWRGKKRDPLTEGLKQLTRYLERLGLGHGALLIFDRRPSAVEVELEERCSSEVLEHEGRRIRLLRL